MNHIYSHILSFSLFGLIHHTNITPQRGIAALIQFLALITILDSSGQCSAMSWTLTISIRINVHLQVGEIWK